MLKNKNSKLIVRLYFESRSPLLNWQHLLLRIVYRQRMKTRGTSSEEITGIARLKIKSTRDYLPLVNQPWFESYESSVSKEKRFQDMIFFLLCVCLCCLLLFCLVGLSCIVNFSEPINANKSYRFVCLVILVRIYRLHLLSFVQSLTRHFISFTKLKLVTRIDMECVPILIEKWVQHNCII